MGQVLTETDRKEAKQSLNPDIALAWRTSVYSEPGDVMLYMRYSLTKGKTYRWGHKLRLREKQAATHVIVIVQRAHGGRAIAQWRRRDGAWMLLVEATKTDLSETGKAVSLLRQRVTLLAA